MNRSWLLARKDLRVMRRSKALGIVLVLYPVLLALLVSALVLRANSHATLAVVNEDAKKSVEIAGTTFTIDEYRKRIDENVELKDMTRREAMDALAANDVQGVIVVPEGFFDSLGSLVTLPHIELYTKDNPFGEVIAQRVRGAVYSANLDLSTAVIDANSGYLDALVDGGQVSLLGQHFDVLGLKPAEEILRQAREHVPASEQADLDRVIDFAGDAATGIGYADDALEATASPIRLTHIFDESHGNQLLGRGIAVIVAAAMTLLCLVAVAMLTAAEGEERVSRRLRSAGVSTAQLLGSKLIVGCAIGLLSAVAVGIAAYLGLPDVNDRVPLLVAAVLVSAPAFAGFGVLAATLVADARGAALVAVLIALPLMLLSLLDNDVARAFVQIFPFEPAQQLYSHVLFDVDPWPEIGTRVAQLLGLTLVSFAIAARLIRRID